MDEVEHVPPARAFLYRETGIQGLPVIGDLVEAKRYFSQRELGMQTTGSHVRTLVGVFLGVVTVVPPERTSFDAVIVFTRRRIQALALGDLVEVRVISRVASQGGHRP